MTVSLRGLTLLGFGLWAATTITPLRAETVLQTNGTDTFIAASSGMPVVETPGDLFASGGVIVTQGRVEGDAHVAGFDLVLEADVAGDLYAAGAAIALHAPVGGDLSMIGFSLRIADTGITAGNVRLLGSTIMIEGSVGGALAATGGEITLNAPVSGDVRLQGSRVIFGPKARIDGTLTYSAPEPVTIPPEVIPSARIVYRAIDPLMIRYEHMRDWRDDWRNDWVGRDMPALPGTYAVTTAFVVTWGFLVLLGGSLLALAPQRVEAVRLVGTQRPALMVLFGVLGIATLMGLVPVAVMTVIGIPFVPIVILIIILVWTVGYVFGAYVVALRLYLSFGAHRDPGPGLRIAVLACGVLIFSLLNFVPVLGWMVNFVLVLFGIGTMSTGVLRMLAASLPQAPVANETSPTVPVG